MIPTIYLNNDPMPHHNTPYARPTAAASATARIDSRTVYHSLGRGHHIGNATVPMLGSIQQAGLTSALTVPQQMGRSPTLNGFLTVPPKPTFPLAFYPGIFLAGSRYAPSSWGPVQPRSGLTPHVAQPVPQRPNNDGIPIAALEAVVEHLNRTQATSSFLHGMTQDRSSMTHEGGLRTTYVPFPRQPSPTAQPTTEFDVPNANNNNEPVSDVDTTVDYESDSTLIDSSIHWDSESGYEGEEEGQEEESDWETGWTFSESEGSLTNSQVLSDLEHLAATSIPATGTSVSDEESAPSTPTNGEAAPDVDIVDMERYSPLPYYLREARPRPRRRESSPSS